VHLNRKGDEHFLLYKASRNLMMTLAV